MQNLEKFLVLHILNRVAQPAQNLGGTKYFDFKQATVGCLVLDTASRSTKWQDMLEIWGAWPLCLPCLRLWLN